MRAVTRLSSLFRLESRCREVVPITSYCRALYSSNAKGRLYTKKHEWVTVNGDIGTIGISNYAQEALGEVVFVQLPDVGKEISKGDECGALESVKAAGEVYSPVSGTITETNTKLESTPALINQSCLEDGWLFRVSIKKPEELNELMDQTQYDKYLKEEDH